MVPTSYYLILSAILFVIGAVGVLSRRNVLILIMCVEMMLNSVNLTLIALSAPVGQPERPDFCLYDYGRGRSGSGRGAGDSDCQHPASEEY